ncbi:MAG: cysteinyl-tRNA synthetase [Candidatus Syntrophoarchaeum caldarius]|uniref:Cysteine--tRNA ligase n=1 Tax=Candidatus Syntropharchaeum caldarium TaxID=1838285 RepID=A0A1F2P7B7_9EURY|nr:MAG: cysteinyl-tRNA synthetase [Candidatus Syntrophoarchaeum caldarius]
MNAGVTEWHRCTAADRDTWVRIPAPAFMQIYNTMTQTKEEFSPIHENRVNLFVCGPTVYDHAHIGHARTYIAFDVVARYLRFKGFSVFYLQNITDLDDKILNRAEELGIDPLELARRFEKEYHKDMEALGVRSVNFHARATEHIDAIIDQIGVLIDKGFAYVTDNGVYFDESKFEDFGKLSHQRLDDLTHHRIEPDPLKRNPGDFALWKKREDPPAWDSPWGKGRPGWHIEDTAITSEYFGAQYDIHGGAKDLIFPHHEAEIAQMESASGKKPMVNYWMHTGFLNVKEEKMSKSLGNFITIREMLERCSPAVFRLFILSTHYRSPIDYSEEALEQAASSFERIRGAVETVRLLMREVEQGSTHEDSDFRAKVLDARNNFFRAMDDDFNTPLALSVVFDLIRDLNRYTMENTLSIQTLDVLNRFFTELETIFGFEFGVSRGDEEMVDKLLNIVMCIRDEHRAKGEWEKSDWIRDELKNIGVIVEDSANKSRYRVIRRN